ncbi:M42 family metallopeptidase [Desulfolucanica intricata]|uniref:M42 family metallopeptidase n=1 Tax=Desulfolucanica intricata TaxID=1285191 RepID=UPI000835301E|nr:M42 family metallopeptidase [Desulfolucanica intricata]
MDNINKEKLIRLLKKFIAVSGVTGFEDQIREQIRLEVEPFCENIIEDSMGNLIASTSDGIQNPTVMICAHMDEIGYAVRAVDKNGYLYLHALGGVPKDLGPGEWVLVQSDKGAVPGVVGTLPPHLATGGDLLQFVDIGAGSKNEVFDTGIKIGDPVTFDRNLTMLGKDKVLGRCLDNRAGCAVVTMLLEMVKNMQIGVKVVGVFASTEEHGMMPEIRGLEMHGSRGAYAAAKSVKPDFAIVVDSMVCNDTPGIPERDTVVRMGKGPCLRLIDDLSVMRPGMRRFLTAIAEKNNIPFQVGISRSYTDASVIQLLNIPVATLGMPLRYVHSPGQLAHIEDLLNTIRFIYKIVQTIGELKGSINIY